MRKQILSLCAATILILNTGHVSAQSVRETYEQLITSAEQGNADAQYRAGAYFAVGENGFPKDDAKAFYWANKSAEQGDSSAQWLLGILYHSGNGTAKNLEQAVFWYQKSADQGNQLAQEKLAAMYQEGLGVVRDRSKAAFWYKKAADQGNEEAKKKLVVLEKLGIPNDATELSNDEAKQMAIRYYYGRGVPQDYGKAAQYFRIAAEKGDPVAQGALGQLYSDGQGVEKDVFQGFKWYLKAAENGNIDAQSNVALAYGLGKGTAPNAKESFRWELAGAKQGSADAQYNVGLMILKGLGTQQNEGLGLEWIRKSAEQGKEEARSFLAKIGERLPPVAASNTGAARSPAAEKNKNSTYPNAANSEDGTRSTQFDLGRGVNVDKEYFDFVKSLNYENKGVLEISKLSILNSKSSIDWFEGCIANNKEVMDQFGNPLLCYLNALARDGKFDKKTKLGLWLSVGYDPVRIATKPKDVSLQIIAVILQLKNISPDIHRYYFEQKSKLSDSELPGFLIEVAAKSWLASACKIGSAPHIINKQNPYFYGNDTKPSEMQSKCMVVASRETASLMDRAISANHDNEKYLKRAYLSLSGNGKATKSDQSSEKGMTSSPTSSPSEKQQRVAAELELNRINCNNRRSACLSTCTRQQCGRWNYGSSAMPYECKMVQDQGCVAGCPVCY